MSSKKEIPVNQAGAETLKRDGHSNSHYSRTPPAAVSRFLRKEVGFGCPVSGCGLPHLLYHHFDPPWNEEHHQNPEGMIALCSHHHHAADGGAFTCDQLRALKKNKSSEIGSHFEWRRRHTVFVCGGSYVYNCSSMLNVDGVDIVYFEKDDDGNDTLSLNIYDRDMNLIFLMGKNDWYARTDVDDIVAPPRGKKLVYDAAAHGVYISLEFKDRSRLNQKEIGVADYFEIPFNENVMFLYFEGKLSAPTPIKFSRRSIQMHRLIIEDNKMLNCGIGISL